MRDATSPCGCWREPSATTDVCALNWLDTYERVAVTALDGSQVEGRPDGAVWWRRDGGWEVGFQVERDNGALCFVPFASMQEITLHAAVGPGGIADAIAHALRRSSCGESAPSPLNPKRSEERLTITIAVTPVQKSTDEQSDRNSSPGEASLT